MLLLEKIQDMTCPEEFYSIHAAIIIKKDIKIIMNIIFLSIRITLGSKQLVWSYKECCTLLSPDFFGGWGLVGGLWEVVFLQCVLAAVDQGGGAEL